MAQTLMNPMWDDYDRLLIIFVKLLVKILKLPSEVALGMSRAQSQTLWAQANGLSSILWLAMNAPLACHGCFIFWYHSSLHISLWTWPLYTCSNYWEVWRLVNKLWIGACRLQVSNSQKLQVRALNSSSSVNWVLMMICVDNSQVTQQASL